MIVVDASLDDLVEALCFGAPMFRDANGRPTMTAGPALAYTAVRMLFWLIDDGERLGDSK